MFEGGEEGRLSVLWLLVFLLWLRGDRGCFGDQFEGDRGRGVQKGEDKDREGNRRR